jgi:hypothetical protein
MLAALRLVSAYIIYSALELNYDCVVGSSQAHTTCTTARQEAQAGISSPSVRYKISECADYPCYESCAFNEKCYGNDNIDQVYLYLHTADSPDYTAAGDSITVYYTINASATTNTSATAGDDFVGVKSSVVFTNQLFEMAIDVRTIADGIYEYPYETFELWITGIHCSWSPTENPGECAGLTTPQSDGYLLIEDAGDAGVFQFNESSYSFPEAESTVTINVNRVGGTSGDVFVDYEVVIPSRGAIEGPDYTNVAKRAGIEATIPASNSLVFLEGESEKSFTFKILGDNEFEYKNDDTDDSHDESIDFKLTNPKPCTTSANGCSASSIAQPRVYDAVVDGYWSSTGSQDAVTCSGTMRPPCIAKAQTRVYIVDDGDAGTLDFTASAFYAREDAQFATVTISRTRGGKDNPGTTGTSTSCCQDIYVHIGTLSGTATAGEDFLSTGQAIAGNALNPLLPTTVATSVCAASKFNELLAVQNCFTANSPCTAEKTGCDASKDTETDGVLAWPNAVSELTVNIPLTNDNIYERTDESFTVYMHHILGGAAIGKYNTTTVYILDDRDAGTFSFNSSVLEVNEDAGLVQVTVMRSGLASTVNTYTDSNVSVEIRSQDSYSAHFEEVSSCTNESTLSPCLATPSLDYIPLPTTTLVFLTGENSKTINVSILNDNLFEAPDEMFQLELVNATGGAYIAQNSGYPSAWTSNTWYANLEASVTQKQNDIPSLTIQIKDDGDPAVLFSRASVVCLENGYNDEYDVRLNSVPTHDVTVYVGGSDVSIFYGPAPTTAQYKVSPAKLYFQPDSWNMSQTFSVSPLDDQMDEDQRDYQLYHGVTSSDLNYHSSSTAGTPSTPVDIKTHFTRIRYSASDSGVVFGLSIFDADPKGLLDGSGVWDPNQGIISAPKTPVVNVFINDNDHAGIQIQSDRTRFFSSGTENTIAIRKNGFSSSYTVSLRTRPTSDVTLSVVLNTNDIQVHPHRLIFSPLENNVHLNGTVNNSWSSKQTFFVSAACTAADPSCLARTSTFTIRHACSSVDANYQGPNVPVFPGPVTVVAYSEVGVTISKQDIELVENGAEDTYTVTLDAEPMHFEPAYATTSPFTFPLYAIADTTVDSGSPSNTTYGSEQYLYISTERQLDPPHPSTSRNQTPTKMSFLTFGLNGSDTSQSVVERAGGGRMGSAYLRLYRVSGGDNGGAFGMGVATAVVHHSTWPEEHLSWNCVYNVTRAACEDDVTTRAQASFVATNFTNVTLQGPILARLLEQNIVPVNVNLPHEINPEELVSATSIVSQNGSLIFNSTGPSKGWIELDITTVVNEHLLQGNTSFSLVVFSRTLVSLANNGLLELSDEVAFASREHPDPMLRPHIRFTPSGRVNVALNKPAMTSFNGFRQADEKSTDGVSSFPDPFNAGNIQFFALYTSFATASPWLHIDLEQQISISSVVVWLRQQATANYRNALFTMLISKTSLSLTGTLANARTSASQYKNFEVSMPLSAPGGSTAVIHKMWSIGEQGGSCKEVEARMAAKESSSSQTRTDSVARYVMIYVDGTNIVPISEVEVYQEALTSVYVGAAAYLPSPSQLSNASQIELQPSAGSPPQCTSTLTFTAHDWNTPQVVAAVAIDNSAATGSVKAVITHSLQSTDPGFNSQTAFKPMGTVSATITDDDQAGITIAATSPSVVEGAHTYKGAEKFFELVPFEVRVTRCGPGVLHGCNNAFDGDVKTAWATEIEDTKDYSTATWVVVDTRADLYDAAALSTSSATSSEPTAAPTNVPTVNPSARTYEAVQMHVYKPPNLGSAGVRRLELRHSDVDTANPLTWDLVHGSSTFDIPFGSIMAASNFTLSNFSSYMRYQAIICRQSYGAVESKNSLKQYELTFSANTSLLYPKIRGNWDVVTTNLSRTNLEATSSSYLVVLDSEPLGEVVVTPRVGDNTTLTAWDAKNSPANKDSRRTVVTGIYHSSIRTTEIATALTFNASTWNVPQEVQVFAVDDNVANGNRTFTITHTSNSEDNMLTVQHQIATLYGFVAENKGIPQIDQYEGTNQFHEPHDRRTAVPTTTPTSTPSTAPTGAPTNVTGNTNMTPTVAPTSLPTTTPSASPTSSPTNAPTAAWLPNGAITVSVMEDDRVGLTLFLSSISVTEGGNTGMIEMVLDSQPVHPVTVTMIVPSDGTQLTVMPQQLTFSTQTWSVPQQVVCTAVDDDVFEGRVPFTEAYTKLIPQNNSEFIMFNVTSSDASYNNLTVGGNEVRIVDGSLMKYATKHRINVTIYDDDSGCKSNGKGGEFQCMNLDRGEGGSCDGTKCICPKGFGGKNCELECTAFSCAYTRTTMGMQCKAGSFCDENNEFDGSAFVESLAAAINSEIKQSTRRLLDDTAELQPITDPADVFYIVSTTVSGCLFSTKEKCLEVAMDTVDSTGALTQLFKQMELDGKFVKDPWNVQFMQGAKTVIYSNNAPFYVWTGIGFFLLVWTTAVVFKMREARRSKRKRMSPDEMEQYLRSQQIFS